MISDNEKYVNLSTQKKDGSFVNTPVWFAQDKEKNDFYIFSAGEAGKVKRIKNFSSARVAICDVRGNLRGEWIPAQAELVNQEETKIKAYKQLHKKYGLTIKVFDFFSKLFGKYEQRQLIKFSIGRQDKLD
ncbi:MAG: PPOX class F420-dependent oxidoreductase [Gammaproteobacteria bacterium]|nr:MAG: PPOX class F420-dependent oxidoreductase [Gammaproteobacteria bacterium]